MAPLRGRGAWRGADAGHGPETAACHSMGWPGSAPTMTGVLLITTFDGTHTIGEYDPCDPCGDDGGDRFDLGA